MKLLLRPWIAYADPSGRSTRGEFWLFNGIRYGVIVALLFALGVSIAGGGGEDFSMSDAAITASLGIWVLVSFVPAMVLIVRRCHDFDATGKWGLLTFMPYLGLLALLIIGLVPGTKGENSHGFDPRDPDPYALAATFE